MGDDPDDVGANMPLSIEFRLISDLSNLTKQDLNIVL